MTCEQASQRLNFFQWRFTLLPDRAELLGNWHALVKTLGIKGLKSYDARLVEAMQTYGIAHLPSLQCKRLQEFPCNRH